MTTTSLTRAYSFLEVKSVDNEKRTITGIATTPSPDRMGDVVEPLGVKFTNPMPLLWQHKSSEPVGTVTFDKPTKNGISFKAQMPQVDEPGKLKDRIDEAWQSVKLGLVKAVSIGFRAIEFAFMKDGGIHYQQSEVLELSLVTIPAQADAKIETIKSIDAPLLAASGIRSVRPLPNKAESAPAASGTSASGSTPGVTGGAVKSQNKDAKVMAKQTLGEQIANFEATRAAKAAQMDKIMDEAGEKNETLDAAQEETYDTLADEVSKIDDHLKRLRAREASMKAMATPVVGKDVISASESRANVSVVVSQKKLPPGIGFVRLMGARYLGKQEQQHPADIAKALFPDQPELEMVLRAPVAVGNTTSTTWAAPLVYAQNLTSEFIDLLVPATLIGRIPGLTRVPFNIRVPMETTGASVNWVGEGAVKPVSAMAFDSVTLAFHKVAGIVPITQELMRFSTPAAEGLIRDSLVRAIAFLTDRDFLDPTKTASTTSPASVTNGVTPISASGTTAAALRADLGALLAVYTAANMSIAGLVLIMTSTQAMRISLMRNALGQPEFPNLSALGGSLEGIPVVTSENMVATGNSPADGYMIVAINAREILLADDGGVTIDASTEASIQMESAPDSPATASTVTVSAFQYNMVFIRAERFITWKKRRTTAVQYIRGTKYA
jgi:HK97 family phage major capsid protein/HK97 family phage prohead protease